MFKAPKELIVNGERYYPESEVRSLQEQFETLREALTKANLLRAGKVMVRCSRHRGKPCKDDRVLCYFDGDGIVRKEAA